MNIFYKKTARSIAYLMIFSLFFGNFSTYAMYGFNQDDCSDYNSTHTLCISNPINSKICPEDTFYNYGIGFVIGAASSFVANLFWEKTKYVFENYFNCCRKKHKIEDEEPSIEGNKNPNPPATNPPIK